MLNSGLEISKYRALLARRNRVVIPDFLRPDVAESLHERLCSPLPWELCVHGKEGPEAISAPDYARASAEQRLQLQAEVREQARRGFAFLYARLDLIPGEGPHFQDLRDFIASNDFLSLMHEVTADQELIRADGQITMYQPGCFLRTHDDIYAGKTRRFAYVLGLTRRWQADWGGMLHFVGPDRRVEEVIVPSFNTLTVFRVPAFHFVSHVANYAREKRYATTGWLFADDTGQVSEPAGAESGAPR